MTRYGREPVAEAAADVARLCLPGTDKGDRGVPGECRVRRQTPASRTLTPH
jgi:hypothetical protein